MKLRGIEFGPILGASGVQGFFGEGYWHHKILKEFGLEFTGCTFVAKTTPLHARGGNMPLKKGSITPRELFPKCVKVYFRKGIMLNAVGLSSPGAEFLFETERWQERTKPFLISFMAVGKTPEERIAEATGFAKLFKHYLPGFRARVGLQINKTCPNVKLNLDCPADEIVDEALLELKIFAELGVPLMDKFSVLTDPRAVTRICESPDCDAVCVSNTIPWGKFPELINWEKMFGSDISPLAEFGGGGLSGKPLLPLVNEWIRSARMIGMRKPINAGGGIFSPDDVDLLYHAGASSVFVGSVANLRPWRVPGIIERAHQLF
jgi:dihydroorotate dehydrogenase